jgi:chaperone required for assembly of F1-ATPase
MGLTAMSNDNREKQNPLAKARILAAPPQQRRFYERVEVPEEEDGFALRLDGKPALTPGRKPLVVPRRNLADAIAAEWAKQSGTIDPSTMPVTRLANSTIDAVTVRAAEVRDAIRDFAGTDLLFYRAGEPEGLVARQREAWDPILAWAEERFGGRFVLAEGVIHVAQPAETLAAIEAELATVTDPFRLAGLHLATTLSGSALIALALAVGRLDVDAAWAAAHVDEDWSVSQWGADAEAMQRRARRFEDFKAAALALADWRLSRFASGPH